MGRYARPREREKKKPEGRGGCSPSKQVTVAVSKLGPVSPQSGTARTPRRRFFARTMADKALLRFSLV